MLAVRLRKIVDGRLWCELTDYLDSLSNAQFRTAGYMLGERFLLQLEECDFWEAATNLVRYNRKAFLVTMLNSWISRPVHSLVSEHSTAFFRSLRGNQEDQNKAMRVLLPVIENLTEAEWLEVQMDVHDARQRISFYLHNTTIVTSFLLLKTLCEVEDDRALLVRTVCFLMKRGDALSFNVASILRSFFGLDEVKGTFSLRIQPFELARLSSDYKAFCKAVVM